MECVHVQHTNRLWCVAEIGFRFAYLIFIVKGQCEIYLASEQAGLSCRCDGYMLMSRSAKVSMVIQVSPRSLLSVDAADITGLMSDKVNYYVGKLSVTQIFLSMKLSGNLVDGTKNALEQYADCQPGKTIDNLTRLRWWMFRSKTKFSFP